EHARLAGPEVGEGEGVHVAHGVAHGAPPPGAASVVGGEGLDVEAGGDASGDFRGADVVVGLVVVHPVHAAAVVGGVQVFSDGRRVLISVLGKVEHVEVGAFIEVDPFGGVRAVGFDRAAVEAALGASGGGVFA